MHDINASFSSNHIPDSHVQHTGMDHEWTMNDKDCCISPWVLYIHYGDGSFYAFSSTFSMHTLEHDTAPANDGRPGLFKPYHDTIIFSWFPINTHVWPSVWCEHSLITNGWCKWSQAAHLVLYMDPLDREWSWVIIVDRGWSCEQNQSQQTVQKLLRWEFKSQRWYCVTTVLSWAVISNVKRMTHAGVWCTHVAVYSSSYIPDITQI